MVQNFFKLENDNSVFDQVVNSLELSSIEVKVANTLKKARAKGNCVFVFGNGGGNGDHFAADLFKICKVKAVSLNANAPLISALTNDNGFSSIYIEQLKRFMKRGDIVIIQSVHGGVGKDKADKWSENLVVAAKWAKQRGGIVVAIVGFDGGILKKIAHYCIHIPLNDTFLVEASQNAVHHLLVKNLNLEERK